MKINVIYFILVTLLTKKPATIEDDLGLNKFGTEFHYIAQAGLALAILPSQLPSGFDYSSHHPT
jgi:hypothetical protein